MKTVIIAEAGVNHNGDLGLARKLIEVAADSGADYVKFQSFRAEELASVEAKKAEYQTRTTGPEESQFAMLKRLELSRADHDELVKCCAEKKITFLSSPFSVADLDLLLELGVAILKIPSGEITNYPLLKRAGESGLPVILSTGMASLGEVESAKALLVKSGLSSDKLTLLQCTTEYPTPYDEVNLRAMVTLGTAFDVLYGLSDHTEGSAVSIAAVALGATVIEKHFTLDKTLPGPDHQASLDPVELSFLVNSIRQVEAALGSTVKSLAPSEPKNRAIARKSLYLKKGVVAGEALTDEHLHALRPGTGLSPMLWPEIVGSKVCSSLPAGHMLSVSDLLHPKG